MLILGLENVASERGDPVVKSALGWELGKLDQSMFYPFLALTSP